MAKESAKDKYSLDRKSLMLKYSGIAGAGVIAGGSLFSLTACSRRSDQWAETSGQAGQINLEAVEEAMEKSSDVTEFEKRVNEIYQGEEMVLIEVRNEANGEQLVSGYADLNDNSQIDEDDEKLFTFHRWFEDGNHRYSMRGYGVNSYYHHPYPVGTNLLTTWLIFNALSRPMYSVPVYHTTVRDTQVIRDHRSSYRQSPSYRNQVNANRQFQQRMSTKHGTSYRQASPSASRQRWASRKGVNLNKVTSASKTSIRSSGSGWGRTSSRGGGFFRGGILGCGIGDYSKVVQRKL